MQLRQFCLVLLGAFVSARAETTDSRQVGGTVDAAGKRSGSLLEQQTLNVEVNNRILRYEVYFEATVFLQIKSEQEELDDLKHLGKSIDKELGKVMKTHSIDKVTVAVQEWTPPSPKLSPAHAVSEFGTMQLTLEISGTGPLGNHYDDDIAEAFIVHAEDFEHEWAEYGLMELVGAFGLPSEAPSMAPNEMPSAGPSPETPFPTAKASPSPVASTLSPTIRETGENGVPLFHTTFETDLRLRLYGIDQEIPDILVDDVEDVIRDFINAYAGPTPNVAFSVSVVRLQAQSSNVGGRRLQQQGELTIDFKIHAEGISSEARALRRVDVDETVQHGFLTEYVTFLRRLKELDGMFIYLVVPAGVGNEAPDPQDEPRSSNTILMIIATALVGALAVAICVYMFISRRSRNQHIGTSVTSTTKEDELTTKPTWSEQDHSDFHPSDKSEKSDKLEMVREVGPEVDPVGSVLHSESDVWSYVSSSLGAPSNFGEYDNGSQYDDIGLSLSDEALEVFDQSIKKHEFEFDQAVTSKTQAELDRGEHVDQEFSVAAQSL